MLKTRLTQITMTLTLTFSVNGCATSYKPIGPNYEKRVWRVCSQEKDKADLHHKGFCYIEKECKKEWWGKTKCRNKQLFCPWGDLKCMEKYKLFEKTLS